MTEDDWMDPDSDEDADVCHHGCGFDVDCEWCDLEIAEESDPSFDIGDRQP